MYNNQISCTTRICERNIDLHKRNNVHIRIKSSITVPRWYFHPATCQTQTKHFHKRKKPLRCSCKLPASTCTIAILPHNHTSTNSIDPCKTSHVTQKGYKQAHVRSRSAKSASSQTWKTHTQHGSTQQQRKPQKKKKTRLQTSWLLPTLTMYRKSA